MNPTPCPDCDPHGFNANLDAFYGPASIELDGPHGKVKVYADERVGSGLLGGPLDGPVVDAKAFARQFCPKHRTTSAKP